MLSLIDGDDAVDWKFDSTTQSLLTALNNDYRFPVTMTEEQSSCYANLMSQYDTMEIDPGAEEVVRVAFERCGVAFTTQVPWRPGEDPDVLEDQARNTIYRLKRWYSRSGPVTYLLSTNIARGGIHGLAELWLINLAIIINGY